MSKEESDRWGQDRKRERRIATTKGAGRHWDEDRPRIRTASKELRKTEHTRARLDVECRKRLIARVLDQGRDASLQVALEALPMPGGAAVTLLPIETAPIAVGCRCPARVHHLDPAKLSTEAWEGKPGRPRVVAVQRVSV